MKPLSVKNIKHQRATKVLSVSVKYATKSEAE